MRVNTSSVVDYVAYEKSPDYVGNHVQEVSLLTKPEHEIATGVQGHALPSPDEVRIAVASQRPDFGRMIRSYRTSTSVAGEVDAMVFRSFDNTLEYVLYKDGENHVWFKSVSMVETGVTAQGVRSIAVDGDALCTPLWEYTQQIPEGFIGRPHPSQRSYSDAWAYLSRIDDIQAYYRATGTRMPPVR